jgi:hypothetical protein
MDAYTQTYVTNVFVFQITTVILSFDQGITAVRCPRFIIFSQLNTAIISHDNSVLNLHPQSTSYWLHLDGPCRILVRSN